MAIFGKKGNKGGGPSSGGNKFRGFVVVLVILAILAGLYVYYFHIREEAGVETAAKIAGAPGVTSVLGEATSPEYLKLLEQENIRRTEEAKRRGESAIATVVRASYVGPGEFEAPEGAKKGCSVPELRRARASGVTAAELRCLGCPLSALKAAGYTAAELARAGYSAEELKAAGFTADELRAAGFSAAELKRAGYSITDIKGAGNNCSELSQAGYTPDELEFAGCTKAELAEAGIGIKVEKIDCSVDNLRRARAAGISAAQIRKSGCGAAAMRAAGFTAAELRAAGFSLEELKAAGFSARELLDAGFTPGELRAAGFTAAELRAAGVSLEDLIKAGYSADELKAAGFTAAELLAAGFSEGDLLRAGFPRDEVVAKVAICDVDTLKKIKVDKQLTTCTLKTVLDTLQCDAQSFDAAGFTVAELKGIGYVDDALMKIGFSATQLTTADALIGQRCSTDAIKTARERKITARTLRQAGCSLTALRQAGLSARDLLQAGACPEELAQAGFTGQEIADAQKAPVVAAVTTEGKTSEQMSLEDLEREQEDRLTPQDREDEIARIQNSMLREARNMFNAWVPPEKQQYIVGEEPKSKKGGNGEEEGGSGAEGVGGGPAAASGTAKIGGVTTGQGGAQQAGPTFHVRAGDVMFAVLDTSINSDEESPILATVVSGKLKGARVVGTFALVAKKVVLNFNLMSAPWLPTSVSMQAVAIDPNTARTALSHKVDNHYMQRYGALFASSFLSGLSEVITSSGSSTFQGNAGTTQTSPALSTGEKITAALGKVGEEYANTLGDTFTRAPTVTVKQGTGFGLLFMQDVSVPLEG